MFEPKPGKQSIPPKAVPEETLMQTRTAPLYGANALSSPMMIILLIVMVYFLVMTLITPEFQFGLILSVIAYVVLLGLKLVNVQRSELTLTDRRIIYKRIKPQGEPKDYPYQSILNVLPVTPLLGRLFKYGHLDFVIEGQVNVERIKGLKDHTLFAETAMKALIEDAKHKNTHPMYKE